MYDYAGNEIDVGIKTDKTLTIEGDAADAAVVGDMFDSLGVTAIEPMYGDIPELYITGTLPATKADGNIKVKVDYFSKTAHFSEYATLKVQGILRQVIRKRILQSSFTRTPTAPLKTNMISRDGAGRINLF